jgi:hypothetical protein
MAKLGFKAGKKIIDVKIYQINENLEHEIIYELRNIELFKGIDLTLSFINSKYSSIEILCNEITNRIFQFIEEKKGKKQ